MGESFLGLPNRFKIINTLLESTYNPNHSLSAYQGYKLSTDYVNRSGGLNFSMTGAFYTKSIIPTPDTNNPKDIGTETYKYRNVYATNFHGNADTSTKLYASRTIELTGSVTGKVTTDLSGNVTISTTTNHNHDSLYVKKTGTSASDPITGPLYARSIVPTSDVIYSLGTSSKRYLSVFTKDLTATNISGSLSGNASTATKLSTSRNITVSLSPSTSVSSNSGVASFDGSSNISINVQAPYLPINGGTLSGNLSLLNGNIVPCSNRTQNIGDPDHEWNCIYGSQIHGGGLYGTLYGTVHGNADTSTKLKTPRNITVSLTNSNTTSNNSGSASFDGSSNISINVQAPYLPINGGTLYGNLSLLNGNIVPYVNKAQNIGDSDHRWNYIYGDQVYGTSFYGDLYGTVYGTASSCSKLTSSKNITVTLSNSDNASNNSGSASFDGSSDISINVNAPYLPISGGSVGGNILPTKDNIYYLGYSTYKFKGVYANNFYGNSDTSTKLASARTLTVGNTGKTFDGSGNVSWSLSEIGAADASVGTSIIGKFHRGLYIVGTKTAYSETCIDIPPGTWLLEATVHHCCGGFRILVTIEDIYSGEVLVELPTINPGECLNHYWSTYRHTVIYTNNKSSNISACVCIDTSNIDSSLAGTVYEGDWTPGFGLNAVKLR